MNAQVLTFPVQAAPNSDNGTVPPKRQRNADRRPREYLTEPEVEKLIKAAGSNRNAARDRAMILVCFRHGLRVSELVNLQWSDMDLDGARLHIRRLKGSISGSHPLDGDEVRALRALRREVPDSVFVFTAEGGGPISAAGFRKMLARLGAAAGLDELKVHPHALRHATGYALANREMDTRALSEYLGHRNMNNTQRYTALNATRFRGIWHKHK